MRRTIGVVVMIALFLLAPSSARAGTFDTAGLGVASVLCSVVYSPVKVIYAAAGLVTGSLAYLVTIGDTETVNNIWVPTMRGTYIITPDILTGEEDVHFIGHFEDQDFQQQQEQQQQPVS
ncbi:MAG TPA: hypothetical protein PKJ77_02780 [Thermodesulfobacteriota bacterium]|nr:hypothetical protein [Deltaproteobacteria bacterium]HNU70093.1 hypothetical protein [Thermodesulfobacteriota bacterium]HOC38183.1 hypothetical protein [Thermodesulfobacteriota bacterium]